MRLPRTSIRRWLILMVIVGLIMAIYDLKKRHDRFRSIARNHAILKDHWHRYREQLSDDASRYEQRFLSSLMVFYHANAEAKYLRAARYPWFHVDPDGPPPTPGTMSTRDADSPQKRGENDPN